MLAALLTFSLRHRALVIIGWVAVAIVGVVSFVRLPLDAFPDTTPVQVQVNATAPALGPLDIERQIAFPLEQAISGLPNLKEVRSVSRFGFAQITAIFDDGTPIYPARQVVGERIQTVAMPPGIERPKLGPVATGLGEVFHYLVTGEGKTLAELRTAQDWVFGDDLDILRKKARDVERAIKETPGSADVTVEQISGQPLLRVEVDREAIARHGIPARELLDAIEALGQKHVGDMYEEDRRFPIAIRIDERYRNDPRAVSTLLVTAANGDRIPLARLAKLELIESPLAVQREWGKRRIVVQANVRGRDVGSFKKRSRRASASRSSFRLATTSATAASSSTSSAPSDACSSSCPSRSF